MPSQVSIRLANAELTSDRLGQGDWLGWFCERRTMVWRQPESSFQNLGTGLCQNQWLHEQGAKVVQQIMVSRVMNN